MVIVSAAWILVIVPGKERLRGWLGVEAARNRKEGLPKTPQDAGEK